ncbi:hypothetical protein OS493_030090 [Desmophyllum pertusum]|uniref:Uncharacterized protein n=1 Tax=Desmophyllum pertusum TaxID=174260 RepID=A0A9X0CXP4_9CNID|nr:hypothetical protein OS493_030090 [Desmophyllum pertusum]
MTYASDITEFSNTQFHDSWKIDLPGGGFIEKPGSESHSTSTQNGRLPSSTQSDEFATAEERRSLFNKLDMLLEERAARERTLQDLFIQEESLGRSLNEVHNALDIQSMELTQLTDTVRAKKEQMLTRIQTKRSNVANLQETLQELHGEERRTASDKIIAEESRDLREQIPRDCEEKRSLQQKVDELDNTAELLELRSGIIQTEEKTLVKILTAQVERLAEDGGLDNIGNEYCAQNSTKIIVVAQIHHEPIKTSPSLQGTRRMIKISNNELAAQLARTRAQQQLAEQIQVLEDQGAVKRKFKKGGFLSSVKKLFKRGKSKSGCGFTKQSKNELNMKAMNDSKPTGMVTMVTFSEHEASSLHKAIELNREMAAQDNY